MTQGSRPSTLPRALARLRVALDDAFLRAARELELTSQQAELLCAAMQPTAVGDLARVLRCDRSNVSRLVDRAAARGLLRRRSGPEDGRVSVIELSPDGERLAREFISALEGQLSDLLAKWSARREQTTVSILNEIADTLDGGRPATADPRAA
jgi:DNA-binding MarR family transcriptional regulator